MTNLNLLGYRRNGQPIYLCRGGAEDAPDQPAPTDDPTKAELEALRKEKADREAAERAAKDDELEQLRKFKAEQEGGAPKPVKAPTPKAQKTPPPSDTPEPTPPAKKRGLGVW